jgi:hypothetical protein
LRRLVYLLLPCLAEAPPSLRIVGFDLTSISGEFQLPEQFQQRLGIAGSDNLAQFIPAAAALQKLAYLSKKHADRSHELVRESQAGWVAMGAPEIAPQAMPSNLYARVNAEQVSADSDVLSLWGGLSSGLPSSAPVPASAPDQSLAGVAPISALAAAASADADSAATPPDEHLESQPPTTDPALQTIVEEAKQTLQKLVAAMGGTYAEMDSGQLHVGLRGRLMDLGGPVLSMAALWFAKAFNFVDYHGDGEPIGSSKYLLYMSGPRLPSRLSQFHDSIAAVLQLEHIAFLDLGGCATDLDCFAEPFMNFVFPYLNKPQGASFAVDIQCEGDYSSMDTITEWSKKDSNDCSNIQMLNSDSAVGAARAPGVARAVAAKSEPSEGIPPQQLSLHVAIAAGPEPEPEPEPEVWLEREGPSAASLPPFRSLDLTGSEFVHLTDYGLAELSSSCPHINAVFLDGSSRVGSYGGGTLLRRYFPRLRCLAAGRELTRATLLRLLRTASQTKRLNLCTDDCNKLTNESMLELAPLCADVGVTEVFTRPDSAVREAGLRAFGAVCSTAKCLLLGHEITEATFDTLCHQYRLQESLNVAGPEFIHLSQAGLSEFPELFPQVAAIFSCRCALSQSWLLDSEWP